MEIGINLWPVLTSACAMFALGALWYSPLMFENVRMRANGYDRDDTIAIMQSLTPWGFGVALGSYLITALAFGGLLWLTGVDAPAGVALLAFVIWGGFVATSGLTVNLFSTRALSAWTLDSAFQFAAVAAMALIHILWL